jgi:hypothetical protein
MFKFTTYMEGEYSDEAGMRFPISKRHVTTLFKNLKSKYDDQLGFTLFKFYIEYVLEGGENLSDSSLKTVWNKI